MGVQEYHVTSERKSERTVLTWFKSANEEYCEPGRARKTICTQDQEFKQGILQSKPELTTLS